MCGKWTTLDTLNFLFGNKSKTTNSRIMETNMTFFGTDGLTSTSANHVANLAKEYVRSLNKELEKVRFTDVFVTIIGSENKEKINKGWNFEKVLDIENNLCIVADVNSLIAWLREAIKERDVKTKKINEMTLGDYCVQFNYDIPEVPVRQAKITREEYISTLSVKERNKMLALGAKAAVFGKFIHEDCSFSVAREELVNRLLADTELKDSGRDTMIYKYVPTVSQEEVDNCYFQLQSIYRKAQAELNGYNHKIDEAVRQDAVQKQSEYNVACAEYTAKNAELEKKFEAYKVAELNRIAGLKIVIPNDLQSIYNTIVNLGKK